MSREKPKEKHRLRVVYLSQRPELWEHLPVIKNVLGRKLDEHELFQAWVEWKILYNKKIVDAMKVDGLIAPTTYCNDVNVPRLIEEAKKLNEHRRK